MEINKTKLIELLEDDYGTGYWKGEEENSEFVTEGIFLMRDNYDHLIDLIKQCVGETSDESAALPLHDVVGRSKLLKTKFTVGQKVIVCGELNATITRIEDDKYWFKDDGGKDWFESENAITAV